MPASPPPAVDPVAVATLRWTALQGVISLLTLLLGIGAAAIGWYQYRQSLKRDRIKATNDAIDEAAQLDITYSKVLRIPNLLAEANGRHYLDRVKTLNYDRLTEAEQAELNIFWDTATQVSYYFAGVKELFDSEYLDARLFFDRLDTFTMIAFAIVYPAYNWLCLRKGFDTRRFRVVAKRAQANLQRKRIDNELTRLDLSAEPYR